MRLRAVLLLSLCSGCNALTGVSDLEAVSCTVDCTDSATGPLDSGAPDTAREPDTYVPPMEDAAALCGNGAKDPAESDVDCGGPCGKCAINKTCSADTDCVSDHCVANKCAACPAKMSMITAGIAYYCIDTHETTNAEYKTWLDSGPSTAGQPSYCSWNTSFQPTSWPPLASRMSHPVRQVDWCDALAYCTSQKKRLCGKLGGGPSPYVTSAAVDANVSEWFRACSVAGARAYPYGATYDQDYCNGKENTFGTTVPVGSLSFCTNPYATFDMSGNVSEWEDSCGAMVGASDYCRARGGSYNTLDPRCGAPDVWQRQTAADWIGIRCCDD